MTETAPTSPTGIEPTTAHAAGTVVGVTGVNHVAVLRDLHHPVPLDGNLAEEGA